MQFPSSASPILHRDRLQNAVPSREVHGALDVAQKTAWFALHCIRFAMQDGETGGLRAPKITATGGKDKTTVMGMLQAGGERGAAV